MFTGLIQSIGSILQKQKNGPDMRLRLDAGQLDLSDVQLGDSIAINGVCLTVTELFKSGFQVDVSKETLERTTLNGLSIHCDVNLEKALLPTTRMGGHFVSGHIDVVGEVKNLEKVGDCYILKISVAESYLKYIAEKGSICIDGISLTVNRISGTSFYVNIVPHTWQNTVVATYQIGRLVNIEVDLIARYLERLWTQNKEKQKANGLDRGFLHEHGFIKE